MPQTTRRWISDKVNSLRESDVLPFHDILDAQMVKAALAQEGVRFSERIYTPWSPSACSSPRCSTPITPVARWSHA